MPKFDDMNSMEIWLKNDIKIQKEDALESKLIGCLHKNFREKVAKIFSSLTTILQKLTIAEENPLKLDQRSMQAITDLSGKLVNLKTYFQDSFLDNLLNRHASIVEIFEIRATAESKHNKVGNHLERKLGYYSSIKDALEKRNLNFKTLETNLKLKIKALSAAKIIQEWSEEALNSIKTILRTEIKHLIEDKDGILAEASNWKTQTNTRQLQLDDIEGLDRDVLDYVKGHS